MVDTTDGLTLSDPKNQTQPEELRLRNLSVPSETTVSSSGSAHPLQPERLIGPPIELTIRIRRDFAVLELLTTNDLQTRSLSTEQVNLILEAIKSNPLTILPEERDRVNESLRQVRLGIVSGS